MHNMKTLVELIKNAKNLHLSLVRLTLNLLFAPENKKWTGLNKNHINCIFCENELYTNYTEIRTKVRRRKTTSISDFPSVSRSGVKRSCLTVGNIIWVNLHSDFCGGLWKTHVLKQCIMALQGHPRSSILAPILSCPVSEIFQVSAEERPQPYSTRILEVFPLN